MPQAIYDQILVWLQEHPGWWSRSEIASGIGRSKTSQFIRELERIFQSGLIVRATSFENGQTVYIYWGDKSTAPSQEELPF